MCCYAGYMLLPEDRISFCFLRSSNPPILQLLDSRFSDKRQHHTRPEHRNASRGVSTRDATHPIPARRGLVAERRGHDTDSERRSEHRNPSPLDLLRRASLRRPQRLGPRWRPECVLFWGNGPRCFKVFFLFSLLSHGHQ